jgi:hypothetical protein
LGPPDHVAAEHGADTSPRIESRKSQIQIEVVSGLTHHGLASAPDVIDATISRIKQSLASSNL